MTTQPPMMHDLRLAHKRGYLTLEKASAFKMKRYYGGSDDLYGPQMVLKAGTVVHVVKVYRRGRAALLQYIDTTGKVWWSWTHAKDAHLAK